MERLRIGCSACWTCWSCGGRSWRISIGNTPVSVSTGRSDGGTARPGPRKSTENVLKYTWPVLQNSTDATRPEACFQRQTTGTAQHAIDQSELGRRLRQAREACGLTQQNVAEQLGVSRPTVAQMELGNRAITSLRRMRSSGHCSGPT